MYYPVDQSHIADYAKAAAQMLNVTALESNARMEAA